MIIQNPTKEQFDEAISSGKTLVDFWASWCGPCRAQAPIAEKLAEQTDVKLVKIDVDACGELSAMFGVTSIPTLLCYNDGELVKKFIGLTPLSDFCKVFAIDN